MLSLLATTTTLDSSLSSLGQRVQQRVQQGTAPVYKLSKICKSKMYNVIGKIEKIKGKKSLPKYIHI